jgi:hypothetical protein
MTGKGQLLLYPARTFPGDFAANAMLAPCVIPEAPKAASCEHYSGTPASLAGLIVKIVNMKAPPLVPPPRPEHQPAEKGARIVTWFVSGALHGIGTGANVGRGSQALPAGKSPCSQIADDPEWREMHLTSSGGGDNLGATCKLTMVSFT